MTEFEELPGRVLLDTCILNLLQDEGEYLFENCWPADRDQGELTDDLRALHDIIFVDQRAGFQLLVSPLSIAELANSQDFPDRSSRLSWALEMLDHWLVMLDEVGDRLAEGGTVRHRFKLTPVLQEFEARLMDMSDFRRDPFDRLLLVHYKMANCDAFLTVDRGTIWRHEKELRSLGVQVLAPSQWWAMLRPWAGLWC